MTATQVAIEYALYEKNDANPPQFVPVQAQADKALETALRESDTLPLVDSFGDVTEQIAELHAHVQAVPFDFPVQGYVIAFGHKADTRWDSTSGQWIKVIAGGAISYPVIEEGDPAEDARLHLAVRTENSEGQGDDVLPPG